MHKPELISTIAEKLDVTKAEADRYLTAIMDQISYGLSKDSEVVITGFGTFKIVEYAARQGVNPKTRERITIESGKKISFKPGKHLKEELNR